MNDFSVIIFLVISLSLLGGALWLMWSAGTSEPIKNYRQGTWTTKVVKPVHPEMKDVEPGTELMGVNFQQKTSCDLEEYKDLQARIEELRQELEEDDDDDDGGSAVVVRV
jgi:ribonuclease I